MTAIEKVLGNILKLVEEARARAVEVGVTELDEVRRKLDKQSTLVDCDTIALAQENS